MTDKNWLIRTKKKHIVGPVSKKKLVDLMTKGSISPGDEVVSGNGYWFDLGEEDLVDKYIFSENLQTFNPITEAPDILTKDIENVAPGPSTDTLVQNLANLDEENKELDEQSLPDESDLEFPDLGAASDDGNTIVLNLNEIKLDTPKVKDQPPLVAKEKEANIPATSEITSEEDEATLPEQTDLEYPDLGEIQISGPPVSALEEKQVPEQEPIEEDEEDYEYVEEEYEGEEVPEVPSQSADRSSRIFRKRNGEKKKSLDPKDRNDFLKLVVVGLIFVGIILAGVFVYFKYIINKPIPFLKSVSLISSVHAQTIDFKKKRINYFDLNYEDKDYSVQFKKSYLGIKLAKISKKKDSKCSLANTLTLGFLEYSKRKNKLVEAIKDCGLTKREIESSLAITEKIQRENLKYFELLEKKKLSHKRSLITFSTMKKKFSKQKDRSEFVFLSGVKKQIDNMEPSIYTDLLYMLISLESGNRSWFKKVLKRVAFSETYFNLPALNVGSMLKKEEVMAIDQSIKYVFSRFQVLIKTDIFRKILFFKLKEVFDDERFSAYFENNSLNWSLVEIRELLEKGFFRTQYLSIVFDRMRKRANQIELNKAVNNFIKRNSFSAIEELEYWIFKFVTPSNEKVLNQIVDRVYIFLRGRDFSKRQLAFEILENKKIFEPYLKKYSSKPLFSLKRNFYQLLVDSHQHLEISLYNLLQMGDRSDKALKWLIYALPRK